MTINNFKKLFSVSYYVAKNLLFYVLGMPRRVLVLIKVSFRCILFYLSNELVLFCWKLVLKLNRIKQNRISVLHVSNFSNKPYILTRKLREHGIRADYLALNIDWSYLNVHNKAYDYSLTSFRPHSFTYPVKQFFCLWMVMAKYDIIHVHSQSFFDYKMSEYRYLKRLGRKFVFHFRGCDVRRKSMSDSYFPDLNCCQECDYPSGSCDSEQQKYYLESAKELGDAFFCTTPDLLPFCPEGTKYIPFELPPDDLIATLVPVERDKSVFRVVTSSNHHGIDGTRYVRDAVSRLKSEGTIIELVELHKVPYKEALSIYASADVYAGKLRMGFYNNANIECMMLGVPCMSYIRPDFREKYCPDCPIIQATPDSIYDELRKFVEDRDKLASIGKRGPGFVRLAHSDEKSILPIVNTYELLLKRATR